MLLCVDCHYNVLINIETVIKLLTSTEIQGRPNTVMCIAYMRTPKSSTYWSQIHPDQYEDYPLHFSSTKKKSPLEDISIEEYDYNDEDSTIIPSPDLENPRNQKPKDMQILPVTSEIPGLIYITEVYMLSIYGFAFPRGMGQKGGISG